MYGYIYIYMDIYGHIHIYIYIYIGFADSSVAVRAPQLALGRAGGRTLWLSLLLLSI